MWERLAIWAWVVAAQRVLGGTDNLLAVREQHGTALSRRLESLLQENKQCINQCRVLRVPTAMKCFTMHGEHGDFVPNLTVLIFKVNMKIRF